MPALKSLRLLLNHIPDKYEHLVHYYGYNSNRARGARRLIDNGDGIARILNHRNVCDPPPEIISPSASPAVAIHTSFNPDQKIQHLLSLPAASPRR